MNLLYLYLLTSGGVQLFVSWQNNSKSCGQILVKFSGGVNKDTDE